MSTENGRPPRFAFCWWLRWSTNRGASPISPATVNVSAGSSSTLIDHFHVNHDLTTTQEYLACAPALLAMVDQANK